MEREARCPWAALQSPSRFAPVRPVPGVVGVAVKMQYHYSWREPATQAVHADNIAA